MIKHPQLQVCREAQKMKIVVKIPEIRNKNNQNRGKIYNLEREPHLMNLILVGQRMGRKN
jgi:hypothetical protein